MRHDQFFGTFDVFGLVGDDPRHGTAMLTEIRNRAAAENIQHLELISGVQRHDEPGSVTPSEVCRNWLAGSAKASRQWALEAAFQAFERADDWAAGR